MAKATFKFKSGEVVIIEGENIQDVMDKFRAMMDDKKSTIVDMKVDNKRRVLAGEA